MALTSAETIQTGSEWRFKDTGIKHTSLFLGHPVRLWFRSDEILKRIIALASILSAGSYKTRELEKSILR